MLQRASLIFFLLGGFGAGEFALGGDCRRFAVTASDGYTNVRSGPRVEAGNVVAALPTGTGIHVVDTDPGTSGRWRRIESPVDGWIHRSQLTGFDCDSNPDISSNAGLAAIERLAGRGRSGDEKSAGTFLAMSRGVDGSLADAYAEEIADWAAANPVALAALLRRQPSETQAAALGLLDFGFGTEASRARSRFEAVLAESPDDLPAGSAPQSTIEAGVQQPAPTTPAPKK